MGHHDAGPIASLAGPAKQQRPIGQPVKIAGSEHMGIQLRKQADELLEFRLVLQSGIVIGNGLAFYQLRQGGNCLFPGKFHRFLGNRRLGLGTKTQRPHQHHRKKCRQGSKKDVAHSVTSKGHFFHCTTPNQITQVR